MPSELAAQLRSTIAEELPDLRALPGDASSAPSSGWTPREELGHLIDSASNNHIRIALGAIQPSVRGPLYAQDAWVEVHGYSSMPWTRIIEFWASYNGLIADLIERIPTEKLTTECFIGDGPAITLGFLIEDYILHLKHHVDHMLRRENITVYPSQKAASTP